MNRPCRPEWRPRRPDGRAREDGHFCRSGRAPLTSAPFRTIAFTTLLLAGTAGLAAAQRVTFPASDGETVHGTWYRADAPSRAVVIAFHHASASGEAEYRPVAPRLVEARYDVLVVDQRPGGDLFGGSNPTVEARGESSGYCEAIPDVRGAVAHARERAAGRPVVLWDSSYSAGLTLRLAAEAPDGAVGALAFSPTSGGPMQGCSPGKVSASITMPVLALRPVGEMELESVAGQAAQLRAEGHRVHVADPGSHGSSMLVAERVGGDVDATWTVVLDFLHEVTSGGS